VNEPLPDLAREEFQTLLAEHGFVMVRAEANDVVLESPRLRCRARLSPTGELDLSVCPKGSPEWHGWSYHGMVGRASVQRLLELALEQMLLDPRILVGDEVFYDQLASDRKAGAEAFTAYAQGKGPRPKRGNIP
jgi:hypothetical protein